MQILIDDDLAAMFDFLFKKTLKKPSAEVIQQTTQSAATLASAKFAARQSEKQLALEQAASYAGQESAALAFILQSEFADARLAAVSHIHSKDLLIEVSQSLRNHDRRVSKYALDKLNLLRSQEQSLAQVETCFIEGQELLSRPVVVVNQLANWDKTRLAVDANEDRLLALKEQLERRLQAQLELQRQVLQLTEQVTGLSLQSDELSPLAEYEQQFVQIQSSPLLESLPRQALAQLQTALEQAQTRLQQSAQAALRLQAATVAHEDEPQNIPVIVAGIIESPADEVTVAVDFSATLTALEQALEAGSLHLALELEKGLRGATCPAAQSARWQNLRAQLKQLLDWAQWGGNVSREELIIVADGLLELAPAELAKQVSGLRARWKELDRTSGSAPKAVWERFDASCNRAYELADAHFKKQALLRQENLLLAQNQLDAMDATLRQWSDQLPDRKTQQEYLQQLKLEWRKRGSIERKQKLRLDSEFTGKLQQLELPLKQAHAQAIAVREQLIHQVAGITANDRDATGQVQQVQQQWQQQAQMLPLDRVHEQKLWKQFRAACDAVFEQRKAVSDEQKQRRGQLLADKNALCEQLEATLAQEQTVADIKSSLRQAQQQWRELVAQLRPHTGLQARFDSAIQALEQRQQELLLATQQSQLIVLMSRIQYCQQAEAAVRADPAVLLQQSTHWQAEWDNFSGELPQELKKILNQRFARLIAGGVLSTQPTAELEELLLRLEILAGLPSPTECQQQRLQLQVQDLQSAMKNRGGGNTFLTLLQTLFALTVSMTVAQQQRLEFILSKSNQFAA